uniref:GTP-binding protein 2 n=1 Tax=Pyxicephalus adspersus TaxID=30357 RepID=A0AAV3AX76_PYXAD|nr:TPA: hypothetical protein GDO54_011548 [Pyxicephalus adspersus]
MKWRLQEGRGEAVYQIGVEDNGLLVGLSEEEMRASLHTLHRMAEKVGADITVLREREVDYDSDSPRKITEVLIRKVPDNQQFLDLRVAVLGNVDSGKSTLLGVLTQGELDNGRGRARLNLFRHLHEIQSGRTSSISFEILGFNSKGEVVNYSESRTAEQICESASKMITFIDLAGHHKYLKTTIFGLTSYCPDFAMLVVDEIYTVPEVGTVVGGTLYSGVCKEGERLVVGPTDSGSFLPLKVCSIQRNRSACRVLRAGQAATLALGAFDRSLLRKGMVLVSPEMMPTVCWVFEAEIVLLFHATSCRRGVQVTVHVGNVRQTAILEHIHGKDELRTGEKAVVRFRFIKHPEYLKPGTKLLFREGVTKGIGHVCSLQVIATETTNL